MAYDPQKRKEYQAAWRTANSKKLNAYREKNKAHISAVKSKWHLANRENNLSRQRAWREANPEKRKSYLEKTKEYRSAMQAARGIKNRDRRNIQTRENPTLRVLNSLRSRVHAALRGKIKSERTHQLLGCEILELKAWLSGWFEPEMTFENYGKSWHIDHNRPCSSFDLSKAEEQRRCFHYLNLRPLFAKDNLRKGAKYPNPKETL
jgi:hypothetical protein